jgi:hypothetical protein
MEQIYELLKDAVKIRLMSEVSLVQPFQAVWIPAQ